MGGQHYASAALPQGKTRYPLYRRLGGPQGRSGLVRKFSPLPGFDPRTVQLLASRYTDCAIPARAAYQWYSARSLVYIYLTHYYEKQILNENKTTNGFTLIKTAIPDITQNIIKLERVPALGRTKRITESLNVHRQVLDIDFNFRLLQF